MFQVRILVGPPTFARLRRRRTRAWVRKPNDGKQIAVKRRPRFDGAFFVSPEAESLRSRPRDSQAVPARDSLEPLRSANALSNSAGGGAPARVKKKRGPARINRER